MRTVTTALGSFAIVLASSCDPVVTADYRGEPVFTVRGSLVGDASSAPPLDLVIAWLGVTSLTKAPSGARALDVERLLIQTKSDVTGSFPAQFELSIYEPPPLQVGASEVFGDDELAAVVGDGSFAMALILVIDQRRPPQLDYDAVVNAAFQAAPMPERVYGVSTATVFYTDGFAFRPGQFLPGALAQEAPGFIVVEPLQGAMARAWADFAVLRDALVADGYATRWGACVEQCTGSLNATWLDGKGCRDAPSAQATCIACEVDCAIENDVEAFEEYDAARDACEDACAADPLDETQADACTSACRALDPIVLATFPGDPVIIDGDELLRIELRDPGE